MSYIHKRTGPAKVPPGVLSLFTPHHPSLTVPKGTRVRRVSVRHRELNHITRRHIYILYAMCPCGATGDIVAFIPSPISFYFPSYIR